VIEKDLKAMKQLIDKRHKKLQESVFKEMTSYYDMFEGKHWAKKSIGSDDSNPKVFVNWLFAVVMTNVPLLTDSRPIWHVISRRPHLQRLANVYTEAGKWLWRKEEIDQKIFRVNMDAHIAKIGWWKIGFDAETDEVDVSVVDPRLVIHPAGYDDPKECPWLCYKEELDMSYVRRMFPEMRDKILPDGESKDSGIQTKSDWEIDDDGKKCTFYEVWFRDASTIKDLRADDRSSHYPDYKALKGEEKADRGAEQAFPNGRIVSFIAHENTELADVASPYEHGESPYIPFYDYVRPHDMIGIAEADQIKTLNWAYNEMLQRLVQNANRYGGVQIIVDADSEIDAEDMKTKIASGEDHVHNATFAHGIPVAQIPIPTVPSSALQILSGFPDLIEEVTGVTDVSKGISEKRQRQSAMEVQILIESSYTRMRQRVRNLEWSLKRALTLITSIQQQFYTDTRNISLREGKGVDTYQLSNQPEDVKSLVRNPELPEQQKKIGRAKTNWDQDYEKLVLELGGEEDWPSRFYMDFDISLETNSSLPQDRQTLANLALRLFGMEAIDNQALLEVLQFPNAEEILERIKEKKDAESQAKNPQQPVGPPGPSQPLPGNNGSSDNPEDIADRIMRSQRARQGAAA
jgi:hypothetical protein